MNMFNKRDKFLFRRKFHSAHQKEFGVSEVIATILLLSITVVITTSVWFWMSNFMPTDKGKSPTVSAYVDTSDADKGIVYVFINKVSITVGVSDVRYYLYDNNGATILWGNLTDDDIYGIVFMDSDHNGMLTDGDFFTLDLNVVNHGSLGLIYVPTNALMIKHDIDV